MGFAGSDRKLPIFCWLSFLLAYQSIFYKRQVRKCDILICGISVVIEVNR